MVAKSLDILKCRFVLAPDVGEDGVAFWDFVGIGETAQLGAVRA